MRTRLLATAALAGVLALAAPSVAGARARTITFTAQCTPGPIVEPPQTFHATFNAPKRVHQGATFTVHLSLDSGASTGETAFATIDATPFDAVTPPSGSVGTPGPTPKTEGDATFTASGPGKTLIQWRLDNFGRVSAHAMETCTPTAEVALGHTRIAR
jgi:hypothetical protein